VGSINRRIEVQALDFDTLYSLFLRHYLKNKEEKGLGE
jgi:hypothetical protein